PPPCCRQAARRCRSRRRPRTARSCESACWENSPPDRFAPGADAPPAMPQARMQYPSPCERNRSKPSVTSLKTPARRRRLVARRSNGALYQRLRNADSIDFDAPLRAASMSPSRRLALTSLGLASVLFVSPAAAQTPADFRGETVTIQIGYGPGGGYDTYGRALARHFGRFIPGNPTVVPKNMPGAGSLRAANHIYNL